MSHVSERAGRMASAQEAVLDNGLRVVVVPFDGWPAAATLVTYRAGSLQEPEGCAGIAHLMEHMMFRGTDAFPGGVVDATTARLGGVNNAVTTTDYAAYYFLLPGEGWRSALEIEADRMRCCRLDERTLEVERRVALEERRMATDEPESVLDEALDAAMFCPHPYGRPVMGLSTDIASITSSDLRAFYASRYAPGNASVIVSGGVEPSSVLDVCEGLFGGIPSADPAATGPSSTERPKPTRRGLTSDWSVPRIAVGFATPAATHRDSPALELLVSLLASGRSSRLYDRLVRADGIATEVGCSRLLQREPGAFTISAALHPATPTARAEEAIVDVLSSIASGRITDEECRKAQRLAWTDLAVAHETSLGVAATLGMWEAIAGWRAGLEFERRLELVEPDELAGVTADYLAPESMTVVTMEPDPEQEDE